MGLFQKLRIIIHPIELELYLSALAFVILFIGISGATYMYFAHDLQSKETIMNKNNTGVILLDRNDKPFFSFYQAKQRSFVPLRDIPVYMQEAVIASEDKDFYHHPGFSITSIIRSFAYDIWKKDPMYGGSTITQQLVKNALLTPKKSFMRKYQEVVLAQEIERRYSKKEILEMYLNSVYFGEGAFGVQEAAIRYFNKPAKDLTLSEASMLAAIIPAPTKYSPISGGLSEAKKLQEIVLTKMRQQQYITSRQLATTLTTPPTFHPNKDDMNASAMHFALMVKDELIKRYGEETISRSGFIVKTTIDISKQQFAEEVVSDQVDTLHPNNVSNGAAVALDPKTGEILALVGSKDWYNTDFGKVNMATTPRSPGSSFKPIVYALAFEKRILTPASTLKDTPMTFQPDNYRPLDYDRKFRGDVLVRRALANSLNIPAVEAIQKVGITDTLEMAKRLGIDTLQDPSQYGLSLVLGTGEVPLLEMTDVYSVFANHGVRNAPVSILSIHDKAGKSIYEYHPSPENVLGEDVAFLISSILSDNTARAEEFGNVLTISRPAAVKTGTAEDFRDSLTIGYTPSLTVGVWVGNNDNTPMDNIAGSLGAAPIWKKLMEQYLAGTPVEAFVPPESVVAKTICYNGGLVPDGVATSSARKEYFLEGTTPTNYCYSPNIAHTSVGLSLPLSVTPVPPQTLNHEQADVANKDVGKDEKQNAHEQIHQ